MHIETVTTFSRFAELRDDWNRLANDMPMRRWEWAYTWAETMMSDGKLMLFAGIDESDTLIGIAPFYRDQHWVGGDVIRLLGDRRCSTDYTTILTHPDYTEQFVDSVAQWLGRHAIGHALTNLDALNCDSRQWLGWDQMRIQGVDATDPVMKRFVDRLAAENCIVKTTANEKCWRLQFETDWTAYVQSLSKSQRRNVSRVQRRVLQSDEFQIRQVTDSTSLQYAMHQFRILHQRRWEQSGQRGCFSNVDYAKFLESVAPRLFDAGALRMLWIEHQEKTVAVDFSLLSQDTSYGYQMGVDPDYRKHEIGRALLVAAMQEAHQTGRTKFDFLRGDDEYKVRWGARPLELLDIEITPDRSVSQLRRNLLEFGKEFKKRWHRRIQQA